MLGYHAKFIQVQKTAHYLLYARFGSATFHAAEKEKLQLLIQVAICQHAFYGLGETVMLMHEPRNVQWFADNSTITIIRVYV